MNVQTLTAFILEQHVLTLNSFELFNERSNPINEQDIALKDILSLHFAEHTSLSETLYFNYLKRINEQSFVNDETPLNTKPLKIPVDDGLQDLIDDIVINEKHDDKPPKKYKKEKSQVPKP